MDERRTCADCATKGCDGKGRGRPEFCMTDDMPEGLLERSLECYRDGEDGRILRIAATVEHDGYLRWCRVQETIEFAKRMNFHKIGIATCVGLIQETRMLAGILRKHGFEVFGMACKAGAVPKVELGIDEKCNAVGVNACNPILQAKMLNAKHTDMNIVMGLCVGHDSLFYKYSEALTTTMVVKDRVTGHNPVAALYTSQSYYKTKL